MQIKLTRLTILIMLIVFICIPVTSLAKDTLTLAIVPYYSSEKMFSLYKPMVDYLNKHSQYSWTLKLYPTHEHILNALCNKEITVALVGPIVLSEAHQLCGVNTVLVPLGIEKKVGFKILIVSSSPKIKSLQDLVNKEVGIFKPITIAHGITKKMFQDEGIPIQKIRFIQYSKIDEIVEDVLTGKISAGGIREAVFKKYSGLNLRVLKSSGDIPGFTFVSHPEVDNKIINDFKKVMLNLNINKNKNTLNITKKWDDEVKNGFVTPEKDYLENLLKLHSAVKDLTR